MTRWLKRIGTAVAVLVLVAVAAFALSRWLGPTDEQERALAVMAAEQPPRGRNAFAALWLMPYDIPVGQRDDVLERDLRQFAGRARGDLATFASTAQGRFPDVRESADRWPPLCDGGAAKCLDAVRARADDYAAWGQQHADLVERAALDGFDHYRNRFAPSVSRPWPPLALPMHVRWTAHALDFVQGRRQVAFDGLCRDIATWRRLGADAGTLLFDMGAAGMVESSGRLLAQMLARSPGVPSLPASCGVALAPPTVQELSLCTPMRGEFGLRPVAGSGLGASLVYDPYMTDGRRALWYAQACAPATRQAIAHDGPLPPPPASGFDFGCIGNIAGCIHADIAGPAHRGYLQRARDHGVRLRLLATLYWLHARAGDERPLARRLAARPAKLRSPRHPVEVVQDGSALRIAVPANGEPYWQLPLNPALR